jgi:hypothetical protein
MSQSGNHQPDAAAKVALVSLGILGAMLLIVLAVSAGVWLAFAARLPLQLPARPPPPNPRLEVVGGADLVVVRRRGVQRLGSWGWRDRRAGLAHIPIDRALRLTAQRGWADPEAPP